MFSILTELSSPLLEAVDEAISTTRSIKSQQEYLKQFKIWTSNFKYHLQVEQQLTSDRLATNSIGIITWLPPYLPIPTKVMEMMYWPLKTPLLPFILCLG